MDDDRQTKLGDYDTPDTSEAVEGETIPAADLEQLAEVVKGNADAIGKLTAMIGDGSTAPVDTPDPELEIRGFD